MASSSEFKNKNDINNNKKKKKKKKEKKKEKKKALEKRIIMCIGSRKAFLIVY